MSYIDPDALRLILAGSENLPGTAASLSDADLQNAIDQAQAEVDARFGVRYGTPFASPPELVVSVTGAIAAYNATLTARRGEALLPNEAVVLRFNWAEGILTAAAKGAVVLPTDTAPETAAGEPTVANPVEGDLWTADDFRLAPTFAGSLDVPFQWPFL